MKVIGRISATDGGFHLFRAVQMLAAVLLLTSSCSRDTLPCETGVAFVLKLECGGAATKMSDPDENLIRDANIYVFDGQSLMEEHVWVSFKGQTSTTLNLGIGKTYSFYVMANAGYRMPDYGLEDLKNLKFYLPSPDSYGHGMPMAATAEGVRTSAGADGALTLELERLMSKLSLRIDRSELREDVQFNVRNVRIGNCPRCVHPVRPEKVNEVRDLFATGFHKDGDQCADLNWEDGAEISRSIAVFLLENPADSLQAATSPYVEIEADYMSDYWYSGSEQGLIYRFYICEQDNYCIERNCHYRVTVRPEQDGLLCEDSWRVDKSSLSAWEGEYHMKIVPDGSMVDGVFYPYYYEMNSGESRHFELDIHPSDMKVTLREDLVEDERSEGRAEYVMDGDGKGFTVKALGRSCMSTMVLVPSSPLSESDSETMVIKIF